MYYDCPLIVDGKKVERKGKYITEDLTDYALEYIDKKRNNPFCLYLSHKAVHFGFLPPKHLDDLYDDVDLQLPPESDPWVTMTNNHLFVGAPLPLDMLYRNYCETVVSVDQQVGRVLDKLEEMGILDDTIVVYAGDNGHFFGEHGLYDKRLAYEESIRIPFFVRYPGLVRNAGRRVQEMVLNIDLAPTLLDAAGIPVPPYMQGRSAVPLLRNMKNRWRSSFLYEHFPVFPIPIPGITAVRTDRYKYITYQNNVRPPELFDLREDPGEKKNIIRKDRGKKLLSALKKKLEWVKASTGYRFYTHG